MNINFPPVDENYIKSKIEAGYYSNAAELVRDAIRRMREAEEKKNELYTAVMLAEAQVTNGQTKSYTPKLFEEIKQNAVNKAKQGKKPNPDVIP